MPTFLSAAITGSSPLARGAPEAAPPEERPHRIIPAGAGSTLINPIALCGVADHPHWRGEHAWLEEMKLLDLGSSPLARGALGRPDRPVERVRIIPAGAGSTTRDTAGHLALQDHPRWRGEHPSVADHTRSCSGSSPLARGARAGHADRGRHLGIIPAGAGSTQAVYRQDQRGKDHPRWRGEHPTSSDICAYPNGIIPAGAGSTAWRPHRRDHQPDHPRWRGEHAWHEGGPAGQFGSSPLARGARGRPESSPCLRGIIPAGAGSTGVT